MPDDPIYDPSFVRQLFDEISSTYQLVNFVSSFGFCRLWRRQCVRQIKIAKSAAVVDLMTGMGELCPDISRHVGPGGSIIAMDYSRVMCQKAREHNDGRFACSVKILEADALNSDLASATADNVISSFGLKTFSATQIERLATEVNRILKPGGSFSFVEISVPPNRWLRIPYLFYLRRLIPVIGWMLMGNPDNCRLLGVYTLAFGNCHRVVETFRRADLQCEVRSLFFGCATVLVGNKPAQRWLKKTFRSR